MALPRVTIQLPNLTLLRLRMARRGLSLRGRIIDAMGRAVEILEEAVQDQLRKRPKDVGKGGGRLETVKLAKNPTKHLRIRSGRLIGSIRGRVKRKGFIVEGRVGPQRVAYAAIHEFGGQAGRGGQTRIRPRPYQAPALKAKQEEVTRLLGRAVRFGVGGF